MPHCLRRRSTHAVSNLGAELNRLLKGQGETTACGFTIT